MKNVEIGPIRPPSESNSLLIRVTRGCHWNKCYFCGLYKSMQFSMRPIEETIEDIAKQAQLYKGKNFTSCFLQDGDALVLKTDYPGLPIWVHTFNPVTLNGIKILMELCRKYPTVPVIFGHMGGSNWMDVIAFAKEQGNAYLDLSAAFTPLSVKTALTEVPERCLFGSDAPFGEPKLCRQLIEFVSPSTSATEMALGGNIERLLQI